MSTKPVIGTDKRLTERQDLWWLEPLLVAVVLTSFVIYTIWAVLQRSDFHFGPYTSPFYSIPFTSAEKLEWLPFSPAFLVIWIPIGFRATCYYFRRNMYRAFFWDPPACWVAEPKRSYSGERKFPFVLNNLHRYFWYLAVFALFFHIYEAGKAFFFEDGFGMGLGTLIMLLDVTFLSLYIFSCHSWRHLAGGCLNCFSRHKGRYTLWQRISQLNEQHGLWFWLSLMTVWVTDIYIRLLSKGILTDVRFF